MRVSNTVLSCALLLASGSARAQADLEGSAEVLFRAGRTLLREGSVPAACAKFSESQRLDPSIGALLNLAECEGRRGRFAAAWSAWLDAARAARASGQVSREAFARDRAVELRAKLGTLSVEVPESTRVHAISIMRDGVPLGPSEWGRETPVDVGEHTVLAAAPGRVSWTRSLLVPAGTHVALRIPELLRDEERAVVREPTLAAPPSLPLQAKKEPRPVPAPRLAWLGIGGALVALVLLWAFGRGRRARPGESSGEPNVALSGALPPKQPGRGWGIALSLSLLLVFASLLWWKSNPRVVDTKSSPEAH